jgi:ferredoxin--NADP+ reductase
MFKIIKKEILYKNIFSMWIDAPQIAKNVQPGQFVVLMTDEKGERIPLTVADYDRQKGTIQIVFQVAGKTTDQLSNFEEGEYLYSFTGPLGKKSEIENYGTVVLVGGGTGIACVHPIARNLKKAGNKVITIIGARSKELIIMEKELRKVSDELIITTDDGSYGRKGFVTEVLKEKLDNDKTIKKIWTIGPPIMMKVTTALTKSYPVETIVSLNTIMVDGTGMCGSCRVTIGGETKFVCTDGPEFDGQLVEWDEFMNRISRYRNEEGKSWDNQKKKKSCQCDSSRGGND